MAGRGAEGGSLCANKIAERKRIALRTGTKHLQALENEVTMR